MTRIRRRRTPKRTTALAACRAMHRRSRRRTQELVTTALVVTCRVVRLRTARTRPSQTIASGEGLLLRSLLLLLLRRARFRRLWWLGTILRAPWRSETLALLR